MSNFGQQALGVIGGVIGYVIGGPTGAAYGFQLGVGTGSLLFPTQLPGVKGPRLDDLNVQTSQLGAPVPWVFGTQVVAGNIIWSSDIIETESTEEVGGKGGPKQTVTTYSYKVNIGVGVCEGQIAGIRRIWADSILIYDVTQQRDEAFLAEYLGLDETLAAVKAVFASLLESDTQFENRLTASAQLKEFIQIYLGDESQLPDPTIESHEGVGNVPAYRGLAYVVFNDFQLERFGNRIPNFRFEVFTSGATSSGTVTEYATDRLYPWGVGGDGVRVLNSLNSHEFKVDKLGDVAAESAYTGDFNWHTDFSAVTGSDSRGMSVKEYIGYVLGTGTSVIDRWGGYSVNNYDTVNVYEYWNQYAPTEGYSENYPGIAYCGALGPNLGDITNGPVNESAFGLFTSYNSMFLRSDTDVLSEFWGGYLICGGGTHYLHLAGSRLIAMRRTLQAPLRPSADPAYEALTTLPGYYVHKVTGRIVQDTAWTTTTGTFHALSKYVTDTRAGPGALGSIEFVDNYPLGPVLPVGHADDTEAFWTNAYEQARANGDPIAAGLTYGVDYPATITSAYVRTYNVVSVTTNQVSVANIVAAICSRVGLTTIDTTSLTQNVIGYTLSRPMLARDGIEGIRAVGRFDATESQGILKFVQRGASIVRTLTTTDLAAHSASDSEPTAIIIRREQEVELPRVLRLHYQTPSRDFERGQQQAARITTLGQNELDVEIAVAIGETEAAKLVEILLYEAWVSRTKYQFATDYSQLELDPADPIGLPVDGQVQRVRIVAVDDDGIGVRTFDAVKDDDGTYTSYAVPATPLYSPPPLFALSGVNGVILDLPALRDEDDEAGYYVAFRSQISGSWEGAVFLRSFDDGATYQTMLASTTEATIGELVTALSAGPTTVWDESTVFRVRLYSGALSAAAEATVLAGGNALAVGADGRWEILQFRNATLVAAGIYELSGLLRGRRGTEWAVGTAQVGDSVVLLTGGGVIRAPLEVARIGTESRVKFVANAQSADAVTYSLFAGAGVALKPFSPASVTGLRSSDSSGADWTISWLRRNRLGEELPDGADIAMSETVEDYEVDIMNGANVLRTLSVSEQSATYTSEQQITDFGSEQTSITVRVYQLSTAVGRGYAAEATL